MKEEYMKCSDMKALMATGSPWVDIISRSEMAKFTMKMLVW